MRQFAERPAKSRRIAVAWILTLVLGALAALIGAWLFLGRADQQRFQNELAKARKEFERRSFAAARARLVKLAKLRPGAGEVEFLLGVCEKLGGRHDAAMAAWLRVPADSAHGPTAALARGRLALEIGQYAAAEDSLIRASQKEGAVAEEADRLLEWLYWMTGRRDEHRSVVRRRAERSPDPSQALRTLWSVDHDPYPVDGITVALAKAHRSAANDDRVWLGLADLATRRGRFDEAKEWLSRCERARPGDPAIGRAWLRWAKAAGRADEAYRAASRQPSSSVPLAMTLSLRAWLEQQNGDVKAERKTLAALLAIQPDDDATLDRLAELAAQRGEVEASIQLRRRKAAIDLARDHYRGLINKPDPIAHSAELARAAESIGRWFDSRAWWKLAARRDPSLAVEAAGAICRLAERQRQADAHGRPIAGVLAQIRKKPSHAAGQPGEPPVPTFVDEAATRGLSFVFHNGCSDLRQLPETMSGGVALLDFDGDGWLDLYAIEGGPFPPPQEKAPFGDRLFRNRGDGRFDDVTAASGLAALAGGYGLGAAVGDYDGDGRPDLFVTRWRRYALYHNLGSGRFEDVTARAGLGGDRDLPTSAAWADLDGDGDLDLYVCHYLKWDADHPSLCEYIDHSKPGYSYCDPRIFPSLPDHVFRNDGGRFVDVTAEAGFVDPEGRGLGVVAADLDGDGKTDVFVANDTTSNYFFRNLGGFRFVERAIESGLAASAQGGYLAGMGVACGDLDDDGRIDLAVTNFFNQSTTFYHNYGDGIFSDHSAATGLASLTRQFLGFGLAAVDANNDGWLDLVQANGHVTDYGPTIPWKMKAQLILGSPSGRFFDVSDRAGAPWQVPRLARGLAAGDIDNDGRIDLVVVAQNAPLSLFHNQPAANEVGSTGPHAHFLTLELEGTKSNRDAVGAVVAVTASGRTRVQQRFGGGSYLSASDHRLHFGLGDASTVDRIEVAWPSGRRDCYRNVAADSGFRLREGNPSPMRIPGFARSRAVNSRQPNDRRPNGRERSCEPEPHLKP
jgi:tetratricopeptide (TPR) repeat protein